MRDVKVQGKGSLTAQENLAEAIRKKAYELYVKRGCAPGNELADWFEAERLVKAGRK